MRIDVLQVSPEGVRGVRPPPGDDAALLSPVLSVRPAEGPLLAAATQPQQDLYEVVIYRGGPGWTAVPSTRPCLLLPRSARADSIYSVGPNSSTHYLQMSPSRPAGPAWAAGWWVAAWTAAANSCFAAAFCNTDLPHCPNGIQNGPAS